MTPTLALPLAAILPTWLVDRWPAAAVAVVALLGLLAAAVWRKSPFSWWLARGSFELFLFAAGGLLLPDDYALWVLAGAAGVFVLQVAVLLLSCAWSRHLALGVLTVGLAALGSLALYDSGESLTERLSDLADMRLRSPWWLLLLAVIPVLVLFGYRRLNRQEFRPWLALSLRVLGVAFLALAEAEPYFAQATKGMTVLFVVDRSLSIPEEPADDPANPGAKIDLRTERLRKFINDAVEMRGAGHDHDKAGLIVFGRRPRLELPPSDAPRFNLTELPAAEDGNYTDIAAALKLALASFPEDTGRRIVLISDGNENLGNALEQARLATALRPRCRSTCCRWPPDSAMRMKCWSNASRRRP